MSSIDNAGEGLGFCSVLFLIFLVLKLTDTISWSWWWVTAPLWGPVTVLLAALFVTMVVGVTVGVVRYLRKRNRK